MQAILRAATMMFLSNIVLRSFLLEDSIFKNAIDVDLMNTLPYVLLNIDKGKTSTVYIIK